jgi:streptogramin lyase
MRRAWLGIALALLPHGAVAADRVAASVSARVVDPAGEPVVGAMVTLSRGDPAHAVTVFSDGQGGFGLAPRGDESLRVRRLGYRDLHVDPPTRIPAVLRLEPERDPAALAAQLSANHWWSLVLAQLPDDAEREQLVRQCTYCHQQGSPATRRRRSRDEWNALLDRMGRMGGIVAPELRERIPDLFEAAYHPATAVPSLSAGMRAAVQTPPPAQVLRARVDEWALGGPESMQHDLLVHPDGRVYSVDMTQDRVHRLDPASDTRESFSIPQGELPLGGVFASTSLAPVSNARVGPHSLQTAPDGSIWITLALGNQLARFDPETGSFSTHPLRSGYYPHTLRFDARGRIWYTLAASNQVGMYDPGSGESREIRLPAPSLAQALTMQTLPVFLWLGRHVDLRGVAARYGQGADTPVPYGIDVAPDGGVWFSQLNAHRVGRLDPETFAVEILETPFPAPRRLRFDGQGRLWIPSFSGSLLASLDPGTREFRTWELPIEPRGSETPYALNVDRTTGAVWICGANSDALIRFEPQAEAFTVFPLPTRVTYTREIDFDREGRVWTSSSNSPASQIEDGVPKLIRLDPEGRGTLAIR